MTKEIDFCGRNYFPIVFVLFLQHPLSCDIIMQYHISCGRKDFMLW